MSETVIKCESVYKIFGENAKKMLEEANGNVDAKTFQDKGCIVGVNNASFELSSDGRLKVKYGPAMRNILDMKDPSLGWTINPTGQSGHFLSKHYNDQSKMFVEGRFRYMKMDPESSLENNHSSLTFYPQR